MAYIVLTKDAPAGSQLLLIDQDFLKSQIPSIIGQTYDRPGNFVTNKDFSKIYCRNATSWELVNAGGGGAAYLAGQGISISNNKISAAVDGTTISFNSAGQLVSAVSPDATTKNFTLANTTVIDGEKPGLKKAMTIGDSIQDTLVWTDGEITWSFEATNDDLLFGYGDISCYSIETYDPFNPKIDYRLPFGFDETDTVKYKGMKWKVQTEDNIDTFTCIMIKQDGTEVASEAQVITGCICHFEILTNATNIHATAASGKLHDPINPLPHDKRLDNAFDEQGFVVIGNKRIQLRDVSNMSVKDMDPQNMFTFYDGTYTYIYDYFRKDYALIEHSDQKTTSIELPLMTTLTVGENVSCGLYDAEGKEGLTSVLSYSPEEGDNITIIKYVVNWNSTQSKFNAKCYLLDPSYTIIAQTVTPVEIDGPCGIYIKLKGLIEISKFIDVKAINNINARYTRFNTAASEADYSMADESVYWRDSFYVYNEAAHKYGEFIMFGAGQFKEFEDFVAAPRNYYMTNGKFRFTVDRTESGPQYGLPYGEWTLSWVGKEGTDIVSKTITETSSKYITSVQFLRENVYGMSIMIKYNDNTYEHIHTETAQSRNDYGSMGIVYAAGTSFNMKPFDMIEYNGVYERSSNVDIATADSYGAVKIDNDTIKVNTSGQIYTPSSGSSYTAGQGIEIDDDTIKAKVDGTTISFNNSGELVASGGSGSDKILIVEYGDETITPEYIKAQYEAGKIIYCKYTWPDKKNDFNNELLRMMYIDEETDEETGENIITEMFTSTSNSGSILWVNFQTGEGWQQGSTLPQRCEFKDGLTANYDYEENVTEVRTQYTSLALPVLTQDGEYWRMENQYLSTTYGSGEVIFDTTNITSVYNKYIQITAMSKNNNGSVYLESENTTKTIIAVKIKYYYDEEDEYNKVQLTVVTSDGQELIKTGIAYFDSPIYIYSMHCQGEDASTAIFTPAASSRVIKYTAGELLPGDGLEFQSGSTIMQAKVDGTTISFNNNGELVAVGGSSDDTFIAIYPTTSLADITAAYNAGKTIFCKYTDANTTCIMNLDYAGTREGNTYFEFSSVDTDKYLNCVSIDSLNNWGEVMHYQLQTVQEEDRIAKLEDRVKELTALVEKLITTEESETEESKVKE